jgi:predicted nucleotidyltransferase
MNNVFKIIIVFNLLVSILFLWWFFTRSAAISRLHTADDEYLYCSDIYSSDADKLAECEYKRDYMYCLATNEDLIDMGNCVIDLEKPEALEESLFEEDDLIKERVREAVRTEINE